MPIFSADPLNPVALLLGPSYLRSRELQQRMDADDMRFIEPMDGHEELYCTMRDIFDLLHYQHMSQEQRRHIHDAVYTQMQESLPGIPLPTLGWFITQEDLERERAIKRLASLARPKLYNPAAAATLREMAQDRNTPPRDLLRDGIFLESVLLVLDVANTPRRIRIGKHNLTDEAGKWKPALPTVALPTATFAEWFTQELYQAATAIVLATDYPHTTSIEAYSWPRRPGAQVESCGRGAIYYGPLRPIAPHGQG